MFFLTNSLHFANTSKSSKLNETAKSCIQKYQTFPLNINFFNGLLVLGKTYLCTMSVDYLRKFYWV